jgi:transposase
VGNLQKKASAAVNRAEAARLNHQGLSEEEIGRRLGKTPKTIRVYLHKFLECDTRWPTTDMTSESRDHERAELRSKLFWTAATISRQIVELELNPSTKASVAIARLLDSLVRVFETIATLDGLNAPEPLPPVSNVTNNNLMLAGKNEIEYLKNLTRYKELQVGQSRTVGILPAEPS